MVLKIKKIDLKIETGDEGTDKNMCGQVKKMRKICIKLTCKI